jgi:23S rRNA pseudouridine955/2504/2580 synthase
MSVGVKTREVKDDEGELRLDRWFKRHFPLLQHGHLEKLLRTGQVRVDGKRAKANLRLAAGQSIRIPPGVEEGARKSTRSEVSDADRKFVQALLIHEDDQVLAINKPPGLAVQGGTGTPRHLDGMLDALRFAAKERPKLVHRLDKDTSGVMLLARSTPAAAKLAEAFRHKSARKIYWALVVGVPELRQGRIDMALAKIGGPEGERVANDEDDGKRAVTLYTTIETAGKRAAWLALMPLTGRTHQLRVHCAEALKTPIAGDIKYGGESAVIGGVPGSDRLHLHARSLELPHPASGRMLRVVAPLPPHLRETWAFFGLDPEADLDPFPEE